MGLSYMSIHTTREVGSTVIRVELILENSEPKRQTRGKRHMYMNPFDLHDDFRRASQYFS